MAKLYGLHRSTLYEAVEKGRVTAGVNGKGQRVIVLSEMIRVYGEPPRQPLQNPTLPKSTESAPPTETLQPLLEELRALREEVKELRQALRLLPAPAPTNSPPKEVEEPIVPPTSHDPDDPHGLRALVRAMRKP